MKKKIIIFKNDAVGDLVQSLDAINNIINHYGNNQILIYLSERSKNFNFLFNFNNVKVNILNYDLTILEKIKLLNKNPLSLDETDSIFLGDFKTLIRENINPKELARIIKTNDKNTGPREDSVKE